MSLDREARQALEQDGSDLANAGDQLEAENNTNSQAPSQPSSTRRGLIGAIGAGAAAAVAGCADGRNVDPDTTPQVTPHFTGTDTDSNSGDNNTPTDGGDGQTPTNSPSGDNLPNLFQEHPDAFVYFDDADFGNAYRFSHNKAVVEKTGEPDPVVKYRLATLTNGAVSPSSVEYSIGGGVIGGEQKKQYLVVKPTSDSFGTNIRDNGEEVGQGSYKLESAREDIDTLAEFQDETWLITGVVNGSAEEFSNLWKQKKSNGKTVKQEKPEIWSLVEELDSEIGNLTYGNMLTHNTREFGYKGVSTEIDLTSTHVIKNWYGLTSEGEINQEGWPEAPQKTPLEESSYS